MTRNIHSLALDYRSTIITQYRNRDIFYFCCNTVILTRLSQITTLLFAHSTYSSLHSLSSVIIKNKIILYLDIHKRSMTGGEECNQRMRAFSFYSTNSKRAIQNGLQHIVVCYFICVFA